ncbi:cytosolic carboxypeptidase Nna1-like [Drosophila pseudoobscura]|uniref:Cytosolic carboxypeptidase Nna1-like n=1 Tax=Drosophila pseudoobscura pseudoobscura TaxID=46245 RepID=A0A6I8VHW1_DROPS|nr:cytosolic carboxypeptidase Nna1 [Drosophila pseudoobscura]
MADETITVTTAAAEASSFSCLLRTLSAASISRRRRHLIKPTYQPFSQPNLHPRQAATEISSECCYSSSCSDEEEDDTNNNDTHSHTHETSAERQRQQSVVVADEDSVNVNLVRANFKCNDMECSLVLGDYVNAVKKGTHTRTRTAF